MFTSWRVCGLPEDRRIPMYSTIHVIVNSKLHMNSSNPKRLSSGLKQGFPKSHKLYVIHY
eukprot:scaffold230248_cov18-Prasinocladus_malaysianus.AAC.1